MDLLWVMMVSEFGLSWLIIRFDGNYVKIASRIDKMVGNHIFIIRIVSDSNMMGLYARPLIYDWSPPLLMKNREIEFVQYILWSCDSGHSGFYIAV